MKKKNTHHKFGVQNTELQGKLQESRLDGIGGKQKNSPSILHKKYIGVPKKDLCGLVVEKSHIN